MTILSAADARARIQARSTMMANALLQRVQEAVDKLVDENGTAYVPLDGVDSSVVRAAIDALRALGYGVTAEAEKHSCDPREPGLIHGKRLLVNLKEK